MALNLNIGILGHVDSGKTSLAKVLSSVVSTAAFDKNPQSQARGITLDLGFSSFSVPAPEHLKKKCNYDTVQYTLVDCPGHASLIKTIIGGSQIIDMMLLVIDITKGIQTQTAECLVIGEITCKKMIIVLNKIDLLETDKRSKLIEKTSKKLKSVLKTTELHDSPIVCTSVNPNDGKVIGLSDLVEKICFFSFVPERSKEGPCLVAVDHCFSIKGQGTVLTGTLLQGCIALNDVINIPTLGISKKVKSMQMFHKPVESAQQGDRLGICVTQFDPKLMERGLICTPGFANFITCAVVSLNKIKYFKSPVKTKGKFHVTIGYETAMAILTIFSGSKTHCDTFEFDSDYQYVDSVDDENNANKYYALLEFDKPILTVKNSTIIGSKLDMDIHLNQCRIGFWGKLLEFFTDKNYKETFLPKLKIYKIKSKIGLVDRLVTENSVIAKNMFKKETNLEVFIGLTVQLSTGENGVIENTFGKSGKVKLIFEQGLNTSTLDLVNTKSKKEKDCVKVILNFKKYIFDVNKKIIQ